MRNFIIYVMVAVASSSAWGKAGFYGYPEMIRMSDVIAVVDVTEVSPTEIKGHRWTYRQKISARVISVLKGEFPEGASIYGMESFFCAQCHFATGPQLVFLKRDGEFLAGSNWQFSIRPITKEGIQWFKNRTSLEMEMKPEATVFAEVRSEIEAQKSQPSPP